MAFIEIGFNTKRPLILGRGGFGVEHLTLRFNARQFALLSADLPVAVLQDQEFFNRFKHVGSLSQPAGYPAFRHKSTRGIFAGPAYAVALGRPLR